jgi:hypothetical protein
MNDLEMVTSKICSAREIIDVAVEAIQKHDYNKAETLAMAAYEFLGYYLDEFDEKFKKAWKETVVAEREYYEGKIDDGMRPWGHSDLEYLIANNQKSLSCDKDDPSPECQGAWNDFWEESNNSHSKYYYEYDRNDSNRENPFPDYYENVMPSATQRDIDRVVKWSLPVESDPSGEYFVTFPDDLLEAADLKEGDQVEWIDQGDGSYILKKVTPSVKMDEC